MPTATIDLKLVLPCKECHRPVNDSESNGYRLIDGILYGWCNECFDKRRRSQKSGPAPVPSSVSR